jgi:hypothetical protein
MTSSTFNEKRGKTQMANISCGDLSVTGTKAAITDFMLRFAYDDKSEPLHKDANEDGDAPFHKDGKFFYRSGVDDYWENTLNEIDETFKGVKDDEESTFTAFVSFAWSAILCLSGGGNRFDAVKNISILDACVADGVDIEITASEYGEGVIETVFANRYGEESSHSEKMPVCVCEDCGYEFFVSADVLDNCPDCGSVNITSKKTEVNGEEETQNV